MDIHKPKAAHSWREFLIEIGTIICGILIALGLEQVVEWVHWSETVHEAKTSIHHELSLATVFGEERLAMMDCADARLRELAEKVVASPTGWTPPPFDYCGLQHSEVYETSWRPWPTAVWRTIEAGGAVSHFDDHFRLQAPFVFTFIEEIGALAREERRLGSDLAPLNYHVTLTADTRTGFLKTIAALRAINRRMAIYVRDINANIKELGEEPTESELVERRHEVPGLFVKPGLLMNIPPPPRPKS